VADDRMIPATGCQRSGRPSADRGDEAAWDAEHRSMDHIMCYFDRRAAAHGARVRLVRCPGQTVGLRDGRV
jgi:hypothetical protein